MELRKTRSTARVPAQVLDKLGNPKSCVDCKTTRTPMWRRGPAGSKSLCNACGIRVRKQERGLLPNPEGKSKKRKCKKKFNMPAAASASTSNIGGESSTCTTAAKGNGGGGQDSVKLVAISSLKLILKTQKVVKKLSYKKKRSNIRRWRKLPEEEQAAFALMALSYGYKSYNHRETVW